MKARQKSVFILLLVVCFVSVLFITGGTMAVEEAEKLPENRGEQRETAVIRREAKQTMLVECEKTYPKLTSYLFVTISGYYEVDAITGEILSVDEESVKVAWDHPYWGNLFDPPVLRSVDSYAVVSEDHQAATFGVRFSVYGKEVKDWNFFGAHEVWFQVQMDNSLTEG